MAPIRAAVCAALCACVFACAALSAQAEPWPLWPAPEGTRFLTEQRLPEAMHGVPAAPFDGRAVPLHHIDGTGLTRSWTAPLSETTALPRLGAALRAAITDAGFQIVLDCRTASCGGFDFRHHISLLPPPAMFFDMSAFHAVTATRAGAAGPEALFLLLSRSASHATWQVTLISPAEDLPEVQIPVEPEPETPSAAAPPLSLSEKLAMSGRAVLSGVTFRPGATSITEVPPMLEELAEYLRRNPDTQVILVGHADSIGSDAANMRLSKARAQSIRSLMINRLGVRPAQIQADGAGVLSPRASNATPEGRALNRRIEVVEVLRRDR